MIKLNKKQILKIISFTLISALIFLYLCVVLMPKSDSDMFAARVYQGSGFKYEADNSLDIMVFGNSDAYAGIIPGKIYGEYGYTSYICGKSLQTIESANYMLKDAYKSQTPKIVVLETDCLYEEKSLNLDESNLLFAPFIYHSRWKEVKKQDFLCFSLSSNRKSDIHKGYNKSESVFNCKLVNYMGKPTDESKPISDNSLNALNEFINICQENGSQIVFLELPSAISWSYAKHNYVKSLADEYSIPFIDLNIPTENFDLNLSTDFRDNGDHLNHNGALKATKYLGDFINQNYSDILLDKRTIENYEYWDLTAESI